MSEPCGRDRRSSTRRRSPRAGGRWEQVADPRAAHAEHEALRSAAERERSDAIGAQGRVAAEVAHHAHRAAVVGLSRVGQLEALEVGVALGRARARRVVGRELGRAAIVAAEKHGEMREFSLSRHSARAW